MSGGSAWKLLEQQPLLTNRLVGLKRQAQPKAQKPVVFLNMAGFPSQPVAKCTESAHSIRSVSNFFQRKFLALLGSVGYAPAKVMSAPYRQTAGFGFVTLCFGWHPA